MAEVTLSNLEKVYPNGFKAVHGIDLEIKDGEFMVLVGPSGCAKSTTLRMIAGLEEVSGGAVHIGGTKVNDMAPKDRQIAMVFQNYALYPHMTVYDNMAFGLKLHKVEKSIIDKQVRSAAEKLEITDLLDRKPKQLSGGQKQRVALGRAIVRKPQVFLFDEPLSNLDAKLRSSMRVRIAKLHQELKTTMIYVTHDQVEAMTMGDRITVMKEGRIMQVDTPLNLYHYPNNKFVAGFIGSPAMNMLECTVDRADDGVVLRIGDVVLVPDPAKQSILEPYIGEQVDMGIRAEHIQLKTSDINGVKGEVVVVEEMGNEELVYFTIGEKQLICRHASDRNRRCHPGETESFYFDMERAHIFHKKTEENLCLTDVK